MRRYLLPIILGMLVMVTGKPTSADNPLRTASASVAYLRTSTPLPVSTTNAFGSAVDASAFVTCFVSLSHC